MIDNLNSILWHKQSLAEALHTLSVLAEKGLSHQEAIRRLEQYGPNSMPTPKPTGFLARLFKQSNNLFFYALFIASVITFLLEDYINSGVIMSMVIINIIIGFIQEGKASRALEALHSMMSMRAMVLRDGESQEIDAALLVPGDIVLLEPGALVPADLRLIDLKSMYINESVLTGESMPVEKTIALSNDANIAYQSCMAYSSTIVISGRARGLVIGTGGNTEIGRIEALVSSTPTLSTPLTRRLNQFTLHITLFILALSVSTFFYGYFIRKIPLLDIFLAAVGLAVAAIPEGLPAIVTIVLTMSARFMVRNNVIIRRLPAVETLGSVTVICSDKTGTLTKNEMSAVRVFLPTHILEISGTSQDKELQALAHCALLCNDAHFKADSMGSQLIGDPTEGALLMLAYQIGLNPDLIRFIPRLDVIPFESEHRFMATLHADSAGKRFIFIKGSPENILDLCTHAGEKLLDRKTWDSYLEQAASSGLRVLALARCDVAENISSLSLTDISPRFNLLGLVGLMDPPRAEAISAVAECQRAGIRVKMVTGDNAITALSIAQKLGLKPDDVIARARPEDKLRLVMALQAEGELVAVTGDGVNDAPALKAADIGVAMGKKGTDAAREASDLIIMDDNFATIAHAVREGRVVFDNIKKSLLFILPINTGEAGVILLAIFSGLALPVTVGQILWVNLVTEMTLGFTLAFEPAEPDVMQRAPRSPLEPLITGILAARITYVSILMIGATFIVFEWELGRGNSIEMARTAAVNMLVFGGLVYLFNVRRFTLSAFNLRIFSENRIALGMSIVLIGFQLLFTYNNVMQKIFHTTDLDLRSWLFILALSIAKFFAVELEKAILRYMGIRTH